MKKFIKTTAIGGLLFLVPIVVLALILAKAFKIMMLVAVPMDKLIPIETVGGVALVNILAVLCIFVGCFIAGLVAKSKLGKAAFNAIDAKLLLFFPGYSYLKSLTSPFADERDEGKALKPIISKLDDQSQLAFEVERASDGTVVAYVPGAPDSRSGNVVYLTPDRVEPLDITFADVTRSLRQFGRGSAAWLSAKDPGKDDSTDGLSEK
ncbi:MAG: hypothetical protein JSV16_11255 [Candidatus Hydrogenedentota bacterium]|nr:MAG: hypothetical protein JSV16_11255 [Candidatus Hydrogenedentota bacterium]